MSDRQSDRGQQEDGRSSRLARKAAAQDDDQEQDRSDDSSAAGSPGRQSTDTDGTSTPPIDGVHGVAAVDSYYGYYSPTREFGLDRDC